MAQLLLAGLRSGDDAAVYRSRHALELAMSLYDSSGECLGVGGRRKLGPALKAVGLRAWPMALSMLRRLCVGPWACLALRPSKARQAPRTLPHSALLCPLPLHTLQWPILRCRPWHYAW